MQNWKYISFITVILLGGISSFGFWALVQHKLALENQEIFYDQMSASLVARTKIFLDRAASAEVEIVSVSATSSDISLIFPPAAKDIYAGCTYKVSWETATSTSPVPITSLEAALINTETEEVMGPLASGLLNEYQLESDSQGFDWEVGHVVPGEYFILLSKINGSEEEIKSQYFTLYLMPEKLGLDEQKEKCKESGGSF